MTTCILCLRDDGGDQNQEHVLQDGLGGRIKLPQGVVCDRCNSATSVLDKDLKVFLKTVTEKQDARLLGRGLVIVKIDGLWWSLQIRGASFERALPPQLVIPRDSSKPALVHGSERERLAIARELPGATLDLMAPEFGAALKEQFILVRAAPSKFLLMCSPDAVDEVERFTSGTLHVEDAFDVEARLDDVGGPTIGVLPTGVPHVHRALSKVALNFLAHSCGPSVAGSRIFCRLRRFVLNGLDASSCLIDWPTDSQPATTTHPPTPTEVAREIFENEALAEVVVQPGKHVLAIVGNASGLEFYASLFGFPIARVNLLPPLVGAAITGVMALAVLDPARPESDEVAATDNFALLEAIRRAGAHLPQSLAPDPDPVFVRSSPRPIVYEAVLNPRRMHRPMT